MEDLHESPTPGTEYASTMDLVVHSSSMSLGRKLSSHPPETLPSSLLSNEGLENNTPKHGLRKRMHLAATCFKS